MSRRVYIRPIASEVTLIPEIELWRKYPDLTQPRLTILASEIHRVRSECVALFDPLEGDGDWSLGTRIFERTWFSFRELSKTTDWLAMNLEFKPLQFSLCVGSVPLRFYKGDPEDPPSRYLARTPGEIRYIQTCFEFAGLPTVDTVLRLAVE